MKIAIISDSHDNLANIKKAFNIVNKEKIKTVLHCGDICATITLAEIAKIFPGNLHIVFGNVDGDFFRITKFSFDKFKKLKVWGELGKIKIDNKKIAFIHLPELAKGLAATRKYDLVFYGHTHKPWQEKIGKTKLVNPGNLAGLFYRATFAIYDTKTDKLELKIIK